MTERLYIIEVEDQCSRPLAGHDGSHDGSHYTSSPQPAHQALELARILLAS